MTPRIPKNRGTEREGIAVTQLFFERNGCVFQEVALQNDFGKDAYIDVTRNGLITPWCAALQVKSGASYRCTSGDYFIPVGTHASIWRASTVPVFGIVYDPSDRMLRWVDVSGYLRANPAQAQGRVPVSQHSVLTTTSFQDSFLGAVASYAPTGGTLLLSGLLSEDVSLQSNAVCDAWALGRIDAKCLLLMRRLILHLQGDALRLAIWRLSHAANHPDIFWTPDNWLPSPIQEQLRRSFRWSPQELEHLFLAVGDEEWGRGTLGQCLDMLLYQDPTFCENAKAVARNLVRDGEHELAVRVIVLCLTRSDDPRGDLELFRIDNPAVRSEWLQELSVALKEINQFDLY